MIIINDVLFDLERSSNDAYSWQMVFTSGTFDFPGARRQTEPVSFRLNKEEYQDCGTFGICYYSIYYDPIKDHYSIIPAEEEIDACSSLGYLIGGFLIKNCQLFFSYPKDCLNVNYQRTFTPEYNKAYVITETVCDEEGVCYGDFGSDAFTNAFDTTCVIGETGNGGAFTRYSFSDGYEND